MIIFTRPNANLLKAYGSLELLGFKFNPKKPTRVSILSVIDKAILYGFFDLLSAPVGK